jgi:hypothetical protein
MGAATAAAEVFKKRRLVDSGGFVVMVLIGVK